MTRQRDTHDVIIVGAGPAGSVCARNCAQQGLTALLLDRDAFPRSKPCGGAVAVRALSFLDFSLPPGVIDEECHAAVVRLKNHRIDIVKNERFAVLVNRTRFDAFLAEKAREAGARFIGGVKVEGIVQHADRVEVRTKAAVYTGRYVVGADGVLSVVARAIRPALPKDEMALALVCSVPRLAKKKAGTRNSCLDLRFGIAPLGYGWDFPHGERRSVGVIGCASRFPGPRETFASYAREVGAAGTGVRGHFIPYGGFRRKVVGGRILLAGDAAGFGDALIGEGIVHAVHSGSLAARSVGEAIRSGDDPAALAFYTGRTDNSLRRELRIAYLLAQFIDRFPEIAARTFLESRDAMERYFDIPLGRGTYQDFLRWFLPRAPFRLASRIAGSLLAG